MLSSISVLSIIFAAGLAPLAFSQTIPAMPADVIHESNIEYSNVGGALLWILCVRRSRYSARRAVDSRRRVSRRQSRELSADGYQNWRSVGTLPPLPATPAPPQISFPLLWHDAKAAVRFSACQRGEYGWILNISALLVVVPAGTWFCSLPHCRGCGVEAIDRIANNSAVQSVGRLLRS